MSDFDDFIGTIDEDDSIQIVEELSEEETPVVKNKNKKAKKAVKKNTNGDMDNSFTFSIEGGGSAKGGNMDWDFTTTREILKAQVSFV
jgi:hypothetical protein